MSDLWFQLSLFIIQTYFVNHFQWHKYLIITNHWRHSVWNIQKLDENFVDQQCIIVGLRLKSIFVWQSERIVWKERKVQIYTEAMHWIIVKWIARSFVHTKFTRSDRRCCDRARCTVTEMRCDFENESTSTRTVEFEFFFSSKGDESLAVAHTYVYFFSRLFVKKEKHWRFTAGKAQLSRYTCIFICSSLGAIEQKKREKQKLKMNAMRCKRK